MVRDLYRVALAWVAACLLVACGGREQLPPQPPPAPIIASNPTVGATGLVFSFEGQLSQPASQSLTYRWDFGDGNTATGPTADHTYTQAGTYTVQLTVTNSSGQSATTSVVKQVQWAAPPAPTLSYLPLTPRAGQAVTFTATATDPGNLPLTFSWDFGDGTTGSGPTATHTYTRGGAFTVSVRATNAVGLSASASSAVGVLQISDNQLLANCTGAGCAAVDDDTYAGSGVGVWRYHNATAQAATITVRLDGVTAGNKVTLLFSNGTAATVTPNPSVGSPAANATSGQAAGALARRVRAMSASGLDESALRARELADQEHGRLLEENDRLDRQMRILQGPRQPDRTAAQAPRVSASPAVGTTRVWNETAFGSGNYTTTAKAVCPVGNSRNAVFWVDASSLSSGKVTTAKLDAMVAAFCGAEGGFARLVALLGDAWGPHDDPRLLGDNPLQDIHVAIVDAPASAGWAGYVYSANKYKRSAIANSNEALLFFIKAGQVQSDLRYSISTLLHEATHLINSYQRDVVRNVRHDTWLEETSAMMAEDVVTPHMVKQDDGTDYNKMISYRLPFHLSTGGDVSYINWTMLSSQHYNLGGAFGVWLNRRFGLDIKRKLVTNCPAGSAGTSSHACLDALIQSLGGINLADEWAHFGATMFSLLPATNVPQGLGFAQRTDSGYQLLPVDVSALSGYRTATSSTLSAGYRATSQMFHEDTVPAGASVYQRTGVLVPPGTTLLVVVR